MKKIFIDTNIIIDLLADRKPYSKFAVMLFSYAENNKVQLFASSHSVATVHYMMKKYTDEKTLRTIILQLLEFITIIPIDVHMIKKGLKSKHKDFEDSIQMLCASTIEKIDCIVTRNTKDFRDSEILVLTPDELCLRW